MPLVTRKKTGKRPAHWAPPTRGRLVTLRLEEKHTRDGKSYGPGEVRVHEGLARDLQHAEEAAANLRRQFLNPRAAMIGIQYNSSGGMVTVPRFVPLDAFDHAYADTLNGHMAPAFHVRGR